MASSVESADYHFVVGPVERKDLYTPSLEDVSNELNTRLKKYFKSVKVEVVECPDLQQPPYCSAGRGFGGNPTLVEVGGPTYLLPKVNREKVYDFRHIQAALNMTPCFIVGAGAGPFPYTGVNCEGIYNLMINGNSIKQRSRISKVNVTSGEPEQESLPHNETRFGLLANLFVSEGAASEVIKVQVEERTGCHDFITSIRNCLKDAYPKETVGLGGLFVMKKGTFRQHVMPDFSKEPLTSEQSLNNWLQFYNMTAPLVAFGTIVTGEMDLDLRLQHFHSYSDHNQAGHYHNDVTPDNVEYVGYFNIAKSVVRIDQPPNAHSMGRD